VIRFFSKNYFKSQITYSITFIHTLKNKTVKIEISCINAFLNENHKTILIFKYWKII